MSSVPPRPVRLILVAPIVVVLELAFVLASPALFVLAAILDVFLPGRFALVRLLTVGVAFAALELATLLALVGLWIRHGPGGRLREEPSRSRHYALFGWLLHGAYRVSVRVLRLRIETEQPSEFDPTPLVVVARHAGPGDSALLVHGMLRRYARRPRIVMKDLLRLDPTIDALGARLPNAFVHAGSAHREEQLATIERTASGMADHDALLIFPEGGNFTAGRRRRAVRAVRRRGRRRQTALADEMQHVIPPRVAGLAAALRGAPDADVLFVVHTGLEDMSTAGGLLRALPLPAPLRVHYWRIARSAVPSPDDEEHLDRWLYEWWGLVDDWIGERRDTAGGNVPREAR